MTQYDWILGLVARRRLFIQKIAAPAVMEPGTTTPPPMVQPRPSEGKNYYVSMGYASLNGETWRPAMVGICVGYNMEEAVRNCVYLRGTMAFHEHMPNIPPAIWQKMDELFDSIPTQKAIDDPLQDFGNAPQMEPAGVSPKQIDDKTVMRIIDKVTPDRLDYVESMQVLGLHIMEALFRIPTAEVFGQGEQE